MNTLPIPHPDTLFRATSEGGVLLQMQEEIYYGLNTVGARIWELLPPECSRLEALVDRMSETYPDAGRDVLRQDVTELLESLLEAGLVVQPARRE